MTAGRRLARLWSRLWSPFWTWFVGLHWRNAVRAGCGLASAREWAAYDWQVFTDCANRGRSRGRWASGYFLVRWLWPAVMTVVQSNDWSRRWRDLSDRVVVPGLQCGALLWTVGLLAAVWTLDGSWLVGLGVTPALVVSGFGAGRMIYPHTLRGRVRAMFPAEDFATWQEIRHGMSRHFARQTALYTRPSIAKKVTVPAKAATRLRPARAQAEKPSAVLLARMPVTECGTWVGNTAVGPPLPVGCWTSLENGILILAAPRKLKTSIQGHQLIDAPGAAVSTQTKPGTYELTAAIRAEHSISGYGVYLLDPERQTKDPSNFRWSPVRGCRDPKVAMQRAAAFAEAATKMGDDGPYLFGEAATVLQALLLIADVTGRDMRSVYRWTTSLACADEARGLMESSRWADQVPDGWADDMHGVLTNKANRTTGAIWLALKSAVGFMRDPLVAELCCPAEDDPNQFDVKSFVDDRATVYLIATDRPTNKVGPLLTAFVSMLVEEVKLLANPMDDHRLDPPLHLNLDESTTTIPMPLPLWAADTGGRGITVSASAQSYSQLVERWEDTGAQTVWNALTVKLFAGGTSWDEDLDRVSKLCAIRRAERLRDEGDERDKHPVLTKDALRRIPKWHACLIHDSDRETIVRVTRPGLRKDVWAAKARAKVRPGRTMAGLPALTHHHRPAVTAGTREDTPA